MGEEDKAPSKVTEGLNISADGKSAFRENPETGETEIYRNWGEEWHGPYGPGAEDADEAEGGEDAELEE